MEHKWAAQNNEHETDDWPDVEPSATERKNRHMTRIAIAAIFGAALTLGAGAAFAQQEVPRVALFENWSVFSPENPRECFIASAPTKWIAREGSTDVTARTRRGDIRFYVTNRPGANVTHEVSYTGGYPFRDGSSVSVEIGGESFELFTEGEFAWPANAAADAKLVAAMRRGSTAIVTGLSSRGKTTVDTFTLIGFTDAISDADKRCAG